MFSCDNLIKRVVLFLFNIDVGITYFLRVTIYRNIIKFYIYLATKNKLIRLYNNLNIVDKIRWSYFLGLPIFLVYYFVL